MSKQACNIHNYLAILSVLIPLSLHSSGAYSQEAHIEKNRAIKISTDDLMTASPVELNQAELDQILAPIALYPDTLLSHILVAATYPLEVIQAARWRKANSDLDEQQALNTVEDKEWDPSVKALIPFNDLLQKFSDELDWMQSLGEAFLTNEEQVLNTVQTLRQKAYTQGNLSNNEYIAVAQEDEQITISPAQKEIINVPYYDTRVVYGNWWWDAYPPFYWSRPHYSVAHSGFYWSSVYRVSPVFYFGGFRWRDRYIYADYGYRSKAYRTWHNNRRPVVINREYSKWHHNEAHRRGVYYRTKGQSVSRDYQGFKNQPNRYSTNSDGFSGPKRHPIDKQRILKEQGEKHANQTQRRLHDEQRAMKLQKELNVKRYTTVDKRNSHVVDQPRHQQRQDVNNSKKTFERVKEQRESRVKEDRRPIYRQPSDSNKREKVSTQNYQRQNSGHNGQRDNQPRSNHSPKLERHLKD